MRKLLSAGLVSMSLLLAQCTTTQVQQAEAFIGQVQAYTAQVCKFVPTVATIISFVNSGIGQVVGAVGIAICNAVPPPTSAAYKALPKVGAHYAGRLHAMIGGQNITISGWRVP